MIAILLLVRDFEPTEVNSGLVLEDRANSVTAFLKPGSSSSDGH